MEEKFHLNAFEENGAHVIAPAGAVDMESAEELEKAMLRRIENGARKLVLDMAEVEYMNSAGLKAVLLAAQTLDGKDGRLALCRMSAQVRMVFDLAGFDRVLTITEDRAEAFRQL